MTRGAPSPARSRGALLLEIMLAIAIFVMSGTAILTLVSQTVGSMERARLAEKAADLARSAMAKMEAGIGTPRTLNGPVRAWPGDDQGVETSGGADKPVKGGGVLDAAGTDSLWELKIDTEPSQFTGLTKVTVTAVKHVAPDSDRVEASYTLRQLVRLSSKGEERAGTEDDLADQARRGAQEPQRPTSPATPGGGP
jgi:type II secretory pathway pseudopilin PulG